MHTTSLLALHVCLCSLIVRKAQLQHYSSSQNRHHNGPLHKGNGLPGATRVRCTTDPALSSFFAPYDGIEKLNECCRCEQNLRWLFFFFLKGVQCSLCPRGQISFAKCIRNPRCTRGPQVVHRCCCTLMAALACSKGRKHFSIASIPVRRIIAIAHYIICI